MGVTVNAQWGSFKNEKSGWPKPMFELVQSSSKSEFSNPGELWSMSIGYKTIPSIEKS